MRAYPPTLATATLNADEEVAKLLECASPLALWPLAIDGPWCGLLDPEL